MRKLKLIVASLALLVGGANFSAFAQDWTFSSSSVGEGTYYLYNVGAKGFAVGANDWGTRASVEATGGIPVTLAGSGTTYTISTSPTYSGNFLGSNGYVDGSTTNWTFEAVAGQENVYKLKTGESYLFADAVADANSIPKTTTVGTDPGTNLAYWKLISKDDLFATFKSAAPESPVPATSLITNPGFGRNISKGYGWTVNASNLNMGGGDQTNQCAEHWQAAFTAKQTISSIPNGTYKIRLQAALTEYTVTGNDFPVVYIKSGSNEGTATFKTMTGGENSMSAMSASFSAGKYFTDYAEIVVLNGEIEIGVRGTRTDTWCVYDNFQLFYCEPILDLTPYVEAYQTALSNAKAVDQSKKMRASIKQALQNAISTYEDGNVDENSQEALEAAKSALEIATANANKSINSYAVIAAGTIPDNSLDGWVCENSNTFHINTWSVEGNPGNDPSNMVTPFIENWVAKGSYLGAGKVYYRLEGLEPGEVYYASALVRSYNEANSDAPNGPNFYINDVVTNLSTDGNTFTYNGMSGIYATLGGTATIGEDGILELGVVINDDRNYNWVAFKNVRMQELAAAYNTAVEAAQEAAQTLEGTIPTAAQSALESAQTTYSAITVENIQNINALVETCYALVAPYATFNALKANANTLIAVKNDNETANSTFATAILESSIEDALTVSDIEDAISDLNTAIFAYIGAANPTKGNRFDLTFLMTNPDLTGLTTWKPAAGWASEETDGNSQVMVNDSKTVGDKSYFYEYWSETAKASGKFALYNAVTLPAGTFSMSCYAFAEDQGNSGSPTVDGVFFYANETQGSCVTSTVLAEQSISFINEKKQEVKIGLKTLTGNTRNWMGIGYVNLYKEYTDNTTYAISVQSFSNGSATVKVDDVEAEEAKALKTVTVTVTPAAGYVVTGVAATYNDGEDRTLDVANPSANVYTFQMPAYDVTVTVTTFQPVVNITDAGWATYSSPYALDFSGDFTDRLENVYIVTGANGDYLELESVMGGTVPANTGLLLEGWADFVGTVNIPVAASSTTDVSANKLVGVTTATEIAAEAGYVLMNENNVVAFYQNENAFTVGANTAYLPAGFADGYAPAAFQFITEVTGISEVNAEAASGEIYNLAGQRVSKAVKGLYIQNGKKILVK